MSKILGELRLIAKHNDQYASVGYLKLEKKGDIYNGPEPTWAIELGHKDAFRNSYHRDGSHWSRLLDGPEMDGRFVIPHDISGIM